MRPYARKSAPAAFSLHPGSMMSKVLRDLLMGLFLVFPYLFIPHQI